MHLNELIRAWQLSSDLHSLESAASQDTLQRTETSLGYKLPGALRELYALSDGPSLLDGDLRIYPLETKQVDLAQPFVNPFRPQDPPVTTVTKEALTAVNEGLNASGWSIPTEVLVFASDGCGDQFGIWLPDTPTKQFDHPIVHIGQLFERANMAVVGTGLLPFLYSYTAFYLLSLGEHNASCNAIGLPESLRNQDADEALFTRLRKWADPQLPDFSPDPYRHRLSPEKLREMFTTKRF